MASRLTTTVDVFTIIAGVASVLALLSLIALIIQLTVARKLMEKAKREETIGRWHQVAARWDGVDVSLSAQVPFIFLPGLLAANFKLESAQAPHRLLANQSKSGWANFLDCLGFSPTHVHSSVARRPGPLSTEKTTNLIEKRLPMRWNGKEFVSLCAALGFQQDGKLGRGGRYQFNILPLPTLWFSPLGHLTLVQAPDGLVVSFRPRTYERRVLQEGQDALYPNSVLQPEHRRPTDFSLRIRACYAVNSLPTGPCTDGNNPDDALFFGGRRSWETEPVDPKKDKRLSIEEGQIYNSVEADLIQTWGLDHGRFKFLRFEDPPPNGTWPYEGLRIGKFVISAESVLLLRYLIASLLQLAPDGYVFTAHSNLTSHLVTIFNHAYGSETRQSLSRLFCAYRAPGGDNSPRIVLLSAALKAVSLLHAQYPKIEDLQAASLGLQDCKTMTRLVEDLRQVYTGGNTNEEGGKQLRWALICRPDLVRHLSAQLELDDQRLDRILNPGQGQQQVWTIEQGRFSRSIPGSPVFDFYDGLEGEAPRGPFYFSWLFVLAALLDFVLTGTWIIGAVKNNVCYEGMCVPENIFMI